MSPEFAAAVQALRPQLMRFAHAQLRNEAWAEDAVSETVLAALAKPQAFAGQSQLKTWLVGILKHKLVDQIRRHSREVSTTTEEDGEDVDALVFNEGGMWNDAPADWGNPEEALGRREFFEVLEVCVEQLPGVQGRIFMMREWLELDTPEICKELGITATNAWVLLHRARLRLQLCLQERWFGRPASAGARTT
jgi:RNA polymerase sigma-70 factor (ECF subfamily)